MNYHYSLLDLTDRDNYSYEGNGTVLDGQGRTAHLLRIHNCQNLTIKNVVFKNGNTETLKYISRKDIPFRPEKVSVFEIIDGGAVVITGKSSVVFDHCEFHNNNSVMCGGAVSNQSTELIEFRNCLFKNNTSGHTGAAIDNLVKSSKCIVDQCTFVNNQSNTWHKAGFPHGQISVFPKSSAEIAGSRFHGGSIPFDYYQDSVVNARENTYIGYGDWNKGVTKRNGRKIMDKLRLLLKLYWLLPKTCGKVFYSIDS